MIGASRGCGGLGAGASQQEGTPAAPCDSPLGPQSAAAGGRAAGRRDAANKVIIQLLEVMDHLHRGESVAAILRNRSLVEEEDQHMKLSLGSSEMGLSSHLQSSKAGTTRIFTSNTHSSVVLQVIPAAPFALLT